MHRPHMRRSTGAPYGLSRVQSGGRLLQRFSARTWPSRRACGQTSTSTTCRPSAAASPSTIVRSTTMLCRQRTAAAPSPAARRHHATPQRIHPPTDPRSGVWRTRASSHAQRPKLRRECGVRLMDGNDDREWRLDGVQKQWRSGMNQRKGDLSSTVARRKRTRGFDLPRSCTRMQHARRPLERARAALAIYKKSSSAKLAKHLQSAF
mmetsp:Transcript_37445/g.101454  ORF Transcript_37445/g.101454 Transcript_37445/m.101454 type:complete len:207 (-) Transcript_37445:477-1097(-)